MKDRIEHTEHKARRNTDPPTDTSFGERRYGGTGSQSSTGDGGSVAAASPAGEADA